jgi:hypothetical protein
MATNPPKNNSRIGSVKNRSQVLNPTNKRWVKRDTNNGQFLDVKADKEKFKGVRKEK